MSARKFFLRITVIVAIVAISVYFFILVCANGYFNDFYLRFTTPQQVSLMLGTSRAAQGLQPQAVNEVLRTSGYKLPIYNYAFTLDDSPFGPGYYYSIVRKLVPGSKGGVFIVAVDPWAVSDGISNTNEDTAMFFEERSFVTKMHFVHTNPNLEFIFRFYDKPLLAIYYDRATSTFLHNDGWLEVNTGMEEKSLAKRINEKTVKYTKVADTSKFSPVRYSYLEKTIELLQQHGDVYLVRLPVGTDMSLIEQRMMPDFDGRIAATAARYKVKYFNLFGESGKYQTIDGNHLYKTEGFKVSQRIAELIRNK